MTRKDYRLIADALLGLQKAGLTTSEQAHHNLVVDRLAFALMKDNPNFKGDLFRQASGFDFDLELAIASGKISRHFNGVS